MIVIILSLTQATCQKDLSDVLRVSGSTRLIGPQPTRVGNTLDEWMLSLSIFNPEF